MCLLIIGRAIRIVLDGHIERARLMILGFAYQLTLHGTASFVR